MTVTITEPNGPYGADYDDAPEVSPLTLSLAASGTRPSLPSDPDVKHVAWWRLNTPNDGSDGHTIYMGPTYSTGVSTSGSAELHVYEADSSYDASPPFATLTSISSSQSGAYLTLKPGRTYMLGIGVRQWDTTVPIHALYRLLLSDYGTATRQQLPDQTQIWGYGGGSVPPSDPQYEVTQDRLYNLVRQGPPFVSEMRIFGTWQDNDPGALRGPMHGNTPPSMAESAAHCVEYTAHMPFSPTSFLHSYDFRLTNHPTGWPVLPLATVVASSYASWVHTAGYSAAAQYERPLGEGPIGSYDFMIWAYSRVARISEFTRLVGQLAGLDWTAVDSQFPPDAQVTFDGDSTLVGLDVRPCYFPAATTDDTRIDADVVLCSDQWRNGFDSTTPTWGPVHGSATSSTPDPDIYGNDRNSVCWLGDGRTYGMRDLPALTDDWTPVTDLAAMLTYEANDASYAGAGLCAAVMPAALHRNESPNAHGFNPTPGDGDFNISANSLPIELAYRTTIRPAPLLVSTLPDIPTVTIAPDYITDGLTGDLGDTGARFE